MDLKTARTIHRIFKEKGLTLSVAESCTGGLICHYLTALPGASNFLEAGVVTYSAESKKRILGISQKIFSIYGIVSEVTARQMAERIRRLTKTDVAVSTTGNLGPDVLENKPKGLVFVAVSSKKGTVSIKLQLKGTRAQIKEKAVLSALAFLAEVVGNG
ncbi:MAG: CinA family protein [Nitrospirota bacterium]|nr:CinA family protein [Nitrospirota bacterium]